MGPNEAKLSQIEDASPSTVSDKETAWDDAVAKVDAMLDELEAAHSRTAKAWTGADAEAAGAAFKTKHAQLEGYRAKMVASALAMQQGAQALAQAKVALAFLPPVGAPPTDPGALKGGESDAEVEKHNSKVSDYKADAAAHQAAIDNREKMAGEALDAMDSRIFLARALLSAAAPPGPNPVDNEKPGPGGNKANDPNGGGNGTGPNGGPVVGGSTSTGDMIRGGGAATAAVIGTKPNGTRGNGNGTVRGDGTGGGNGNGSGDGLEGIDPGTAAGTAGTAGGGGLGGVASGAGLLGAGRGALNRLAGRGAGGAGGAGSASAPGRTAGMQKGPTLGARSANASSAGSGASSATAGQGAQPGTGQARPGQSGPGQGGSRPASPSNGARGGQASGGRSGAQPGSRGGRGSQGSRDDNDTSVKHLVFEDDQWLDDEETTPGVLS